MEDRDVVDALAETLFGRDHPDRLWSDPGTNRLGVASATEKATYRGFATAQLASANMVAAPSHRTAALAADVVALKEGAKVSRPSRRA